MKKAVFSFTLALAVAGSWAFYPRVAEPGGYMMVISNCAYKKSDIIVIAPDGNLEETPLPFKGIVDADVTAGLIPIQKATLARLNLLAIAGWHVIHTSSATPSAGAGYNVSQTIYLLEKNH